MSMEELYAEVIVDVPTRQTNQPYTYLVPTELTASIQPGMRVTVPFGHRELLGFVVGLTTEASVRAERLKEIDSVLDFMPVVNPELLQLSEELADDVFAFRITVLKTLLPNALKADYRYCVREGTGLSEEDRAHFLAGKAEFVGQLKDLTKADRRRLMKLRQTGQLTLEPLIHDRAHIKTQLAYQITDDLAQLQEGANQLRANAGQQLRLNAFAMDNLGQVFTKKELEDMLDISAASLRTAVKKGWLTTRQVETLRRPLGTGSVKPSQPLPLTAEQANAYDRIVAVMGKDISQPFLLEGITGSGKTEVYLQAAQKAIERGKTVLFLVPEIALTPQMVTRVRSRFGEKIAVLHSGLNDGERYDEWRRIQRGDVDVVVGARSAVFAPLTQIGLIIVDEEHEVTYQQQDNPRYNARNVALWRGRYHHVPVILGSATPSLESRARAQKGRYQLLVLTQRPGNAQLPQVHVIDLKETMADGKETNFSPALLAKIKQRKDAGEQTVLLLNRRGYSSFVMCRDCGYVPRDPNCNLAMTLHMDTHTLRCHYCGYQEAIPNRCPVCHSKRIRYYGTGTEKVETELKELLPDLRVIRIDQDTTRKKGSLSRALKRFGEGDADVLLGTQMVAKGLDFPNVTLVGVLNADTALGLPDFHASERTFQLLTQVSGRAGRAHKPGEVIVQTFNPQHYAIRFAKAHDYEGFYHYEMRVRQMGQYPPFYYTIQIQTSDRDEAQVAKYTAQIARWLRLRLTQEVLMLGPAPRPIAKLKNRYYFQILLKFKDLHTNDVILRELVERSQQVKGDFQLSVIRNPLTFM